SGRVAFLLCQNDAAMVPTAGGPFRVDFVEITNVEGIEHTALSGGKTEMVFVRPPDHAGLSRRHQVNSARPKATNNLAVHRILVHVQTKAAHIGYAGEGKISSIAASSRAMSPSISSRFAW